jgi:uncharacterized protein (DUF1501 family)
MPETITRRSFLQSSSLLAGASLLPRWMPRLAFSPPARGPLSDVLIAVFLRGAADALNMVVPHGDEAYYTLRPTLGIPRPDDRRALPKTCAIDLDGFFGLHPSLSPLLPAWETGNLAFVHACGAPDESRSHFKAMELMERGVEDERGPASGWIGRHLATLDTGNLSPLRAIALGEIPQRSLTGPVPVTALRSIADFHLAGDPQALARMQNALSSLYAGGDPVSQVGQETLEILNTIRMMDPVDYRPSSDLVYPDSDFGMGLRQIAALIKAQVGLEVGAIDVGGWDTHFAQGASEGQMAALMWDLASGLAAFHADLHDLVDRLTVVVMSEFGRRAAENGSLGTDHGHGSVMFLLGGHVNGGRVHGRWPGLADGQLVGPGDLAVTTDYRDVLGEVCLKRLGNPALNEIFPGFAVTLGDLVR